jgi:hypothetical protein
MIFSIDTAKILCYSACIETTKGYEMKYETPTYLCPVWGLKFFKGSHIDFTIGNDLIDLVNFHTGVLNKHLINKTVKTAMLKDELEHSYGRGFFRGFADKILCSDLFKQGIIR